MLDVAGRDMITAVKLTLRMKVIVTHGIPESRAAVSAVDDVRLALCWDV
jgi:hypothetical protein